MNSINPAYQVLVVNDNVAALTAGQPVSALAIGQIGFFSYETNLSIDGTVPSQNKSFYIAVGVDPQATGSLADITKSAGNNIQQAGIRAMTVKPYVAAQNKELLLKIGAVTCNTEYGLKFEIKSEALAHLYGFNFPYETFTGFTAPCTDGCVDCAAGDPNSLVEDFYKNINLDPNKIFQAIMTSPLTSNVINDATQWALGFNSLAVPAGVPTGTPTTGTGAVTAGTLYTRIVGVNGDGVTLPGSESLGVVLSATGEIAWAWIALTGATSYRIYVGTAAGAENTYFTSSTNSYTQTANAGTAGTVPVFNVANTINPNTGLTANLQINVLPDALTIYSQINLKYANPRQVNVFMSLLTDPNSPNGFGTFGPDTTQSDLQEIIYEDGSGYDIQQLEYIAGGWNGNPGPYRTSELVGVPTSNIQYYSSLAGHYNMYALTYENKGVGGGHPYESSLATYIVIPTANTTAINSINATLYRIVEGATGNDSTVNTAYPVTEFDSGVLAE